MTLKTDKGVVFAPSSDLGDVARGLDSDIETLVRDKVRGIIKTCYDRGDRVFITYMESWWGIVTAEVIIALKLHYPDVTFVVFVSHRGGERDYPFAMRQRYYRTIANADMDICTGRDSDSETTIPQNLIIVNIASTIIDYNIGTNLHTVNSTGVSLKQLANAKGIRYINIFKMLNLHHY